MFQHVLMRLQVVLLAVSFFAAAPLSAADIELATDAPPPLSPEASRQRFQLPPGFSIEPVATEPLLADPVAMAFDASGALFVCEIHGYNLEGYLDVLELNRSGELDTAVRRIPANEAALRQAAAEQYGTVKRLEDTNGDGRFDRVTVWADRLPCCYGVVPARDGVIVLCAPEIVYLADRDGDGRPEVRETLFTGFGVGEMWSRINNPRWGLDNWIYAVNGIGSGGRISGPHLPAPVQIGATCFRFRADGTAIEPVSGSTSGFGLAMNDWGDRFLVSNQQHVLFVAPLPHRYLIRNPYRASPNPVVNISTYGHPARVYPTSQPDPWRLARANDPAWVKFYGVAEATASGFFTAASGQTIYRADRFPAEYQEGHFSVDNAQNLVHHCRLVRDGAGYRAVRPDETEQVEFLTSSEQWFRPVNLAVGPDGALYIVDMYRSIIEDYSAIPRYLQQQYIESLIAGGEKGRIWRVVYGEVPPQRPVFPHGADAATLVQTLDHSNAWWRETAQRLLVERGDRSVSEALATLARRGSTPQARLHAVYTLDGLGQLSAAVVEAALGDPHFAVRTHALQLAERWLGEPSSLDQPIFALVNDPDPRVRLQLALTLGEMRSAAATVALHRLAVEQGDDRWMQAAILCSTSESAADLIAAVLRDDEAAGQGRALLTGLAAVVGARQQTRELAAVLQATATSGASATSKQRVLRGLLEGLPPSPASRLTSPTATEALAGLLAATEVDVKDAAFQLAKRLRFHEAAEMNAVLQEAVRTARDSQSPLAARITALAVLDGADADRVAPLADELLDPRQPIELQLAVIGVISSLDDPRAAGWLIADWPARTPAAQQAVLEAIFARQQRLPPLLEAIAERRIPLASLDAFRRTQLLQNPDAAIRRRAETLLSRQTQPAQQRTLLDRYREALSGPRDAQRGLAVFEKQCSKCHQAQGRGSVVGPDLSATIRRSDEMLLSDVLDPNNQITVGFNQYTVVTADGHILSGVLAAETATSVTLRREQAVDTTILRKDIDDLAASSISMMPERLEQEVSPQDVADLIAYLREAFGPVPPPRIVLFEDDPKFPAWLNEGQGTATIETEDVHSGTASLAVTPPQRFAARIPGWQYVIREHPRPGEYRYLQFAWKADTARGVMLELADQGTWPPADRPLRRYVSGANDTGWQALQISPDPPGQWIVVTRDLWKDFGDMVLTGLAPTAIGGRALFDRIDLLQSCEEQPPRPE
ncbi:MAG: c-type cytochrome [Pirellulaceae bacterium]|nr:c-type cytochrome [Pirellulaceae bacterium]